MGKSPEKREPLDRALTPRSGSLLSAVLSSSTVDDSTGLQPSVKAESQGRQSCPSREARESREPQVRLRSTDCHGKDAKGRAPGVRQLAPSGQVPWTDSGIRRLQTRTGQR